ncbi:MAG: ABC transporter substrate-binding protein [SAR202 cluster bacterium]|nr:ABC transporter substrate-binding protein [SAR202 cluster bacterium]
MARPSVRIYRLTVFAIILSLLLAACGSDPTPTATSAPTATPTTAKQPGTTPVATSSQPTATPTAASSTPRFDALVAKAKAEAAQNNTVTGWYESIDPAVIRAWEQEFQKEYGFAIKVATIPGHSARDAPVQALAGFKANKAIADSQTGNVDSIITLAEAGGLMKPDWAALYEGLPIYKVQHQAVPVETVLNTGEPLSAYCAVGSFYVWPFTYNTNAVTKQEIAAGISYDDLATNPKWKNRVLTDNRFLGVYFFPLAPGWSEERQKTWVKALKANGAKGIAGGSTGLIQALLSGEGDIAIASGGFDEKAKGAPIDILVPKDGWITGGLGMSCTPKLVTTGGTNLAQLWNAWRHTRGNEVMQVVTKSPVTVPGISNDYTKLLANAGIRIPQDLVMARTLAEFNSIGKWRQDAIDAFK